MTKRETIAQNMNTGVPLKLIKIARHSATARTEMRSGQVLSVALSGLITQSAMLHFKSRIADLYGAGVSAFVADYRCAVLAMDGAALDSVLEGDFSPTSAIMPAALLVPSGDIPVWVGHCLRMASRGVLRQCFSEPLSALAWAQRHAERSRAK